MSDNLFEQYQRQKSAVKGVVEAVEKAGWLKAAEARQLLDNLSKDRLTLGVIGQMKCGKSTFLNSFVFGDTVLPTATTPMTAALSVIGHGSRAGLRAEFQTAEEWQSLQDRARQRADGKSEVEFSAIKAAQELTGKASAVPGGVQQWLGKTKTDTLDHLADYVGANGAWVSITKAVNIEMPHDYLRGVSIVDTPGFNDPVASREERTRQFLNNADVVVLMLYAGRPFDATDADILTRQVAQAGIGRVIVAINKYDIPLCSEQHTSEEEIVAYVRGQIDDAVRKTNNQALSDALGSNAPIAMSAELALIGQLSRQKLDATPALRDAFKRHCDDFGVATQAELLALSHHDRLVAAIKEVIATEKYELLLRKPLSPLRVVCQEREQAAQAALLKAEGAVKSYSSSDEQLEQRIATLTSAQSKIAKALDNLTLDIEKTLKQGIDDAAHSLDRFFRDAENNLENVANGEYARCSFNKGLQDRIQYEFKLLCDRDIPHNCQEAIKRINLHLQRNIDRCLDRIFHHVSFEEFIADFDKEEFQEDCKNRIAVATDALDKQPESSSSETQFILRVISAFDISDILPDFLGLIGGDSKDTNLKKLRGRFERLQPREFLLPLLAQKEVVDGAFRTLFQTELLEPLLKQARDAKANKASRAAKLQEARSTLEKAKTALGEAKKTAQTLLQQIDSAAAQTK